MKIHSALTQSKLKSSLNYLLAIVIIGMVISFREELSELSDQAIATYIVGFAAIIIGLWQFRRTFVQKNRIKVFDELSSDISSAKDMLESINQQCQRLVQVLADAADGAAVENPSSLNEAQTSARIDRVNEVFNEHEKHIKSIFGSYLNVLKLIRKIEKSTVIKKASRDAARYLFYTASEQHNLVNKANAVLQSFNVTPPLGEKPNISPQTFNAFRELNDLINQKNLIMSNYLDDLEVIIHNDLVNNVFGNAKFSTQTFEHLTPNGFTDSRVKDDLL